MGDPLSIASGVAGLVSLGLTVCNSLHTYFSAIKDRKDDVAIATQSLALFKFHIFAVQSSASKLGHRHSLAIDGLQLSLINCEMQLKSLETLLNELVPTDDLSLAKEVWRRQKLIARYPFDRKKLVQLEEYLSRANTTLSSFIQTLNLDINIRMSDELEAFKASLVALDINTQTTLKTITTRLDVIGPKVERSTLELAVLPSRIEDRIAAAGSNSIILHQAAMSLAEIKTSFSGSKRSFEDFNEAHSKPCHLENAELERRLCKKLADMDCTCGASKSKTSNRPPRRMYRFWGGLTISRQGDVRANHRPGCIFFQKSRRNISKTSLTYFGLLSLFSQSFTASLTQEYPAGPYSVSFGLQPCNIVKSSPALRLFDMQPQSIYQIFNHNITGLGPGHIAENFIKELRVIYRSGKASPFDVDQDGNNIAHMCLQACLGYFNYQEGLKSSDIAIDAICKMLTYMADIGVPITASNFRQSNVLTLSIESYRNFWILPRLYRLVMNRDSNFYHAELAHNGRLAVNLWFENGEEWARQLNVLCEYPEISEDIGFSELFLAVMKRDHGRLQAILAEEDSILNISQTDFYERNILHVSSNWPDGLRLLLQRQDVRPLMDMNSASFFHLRPLDYALFYSKVYCNAPDQWTVCDGCTCYVAVQLLLEADCNVTVGFGRPETLAGCSLKARKLFFEHLKDRRERLRNVAFDILPEEFLSQYGVTTNSLPDKTATLLWDELQKIKEQRDQLVVGLNDSLKPYSDDFVIEPESFFDYPHHLQVAVLALDYGLAPKDESRVPTLLSGNYIIPGPTSGRLEEVSLNYLDWLLQYDLNLELSLEPFRFSTLHRVAVFIGNRIFLSLNRVKFSDLPHQDVSISELQDSKTLLPAICHSKAQCSIPCPCSSGMFIRPLAHILPGMLWYQDFDGSTYFFWNIGENIELVVRSIDLLKLAKCSSEQTYMAKCAIHILTMMSLGVRHLPICLSQGYDDPENSVCEEEWKEILDEDQELIDRLQALDEEFGEAFDRQNAPIAEFLRGYWLTRMEEVTGELDKPLADDDRYDLWEAGVVLEEDDTDGSEFYIEDMEDEIPVRVVSLEDG